MAEHGLVAIDPVALLRLEATLHGVAEVYRHRTWTITEALAGTGESAAGELAELRRVVAWCESQRDDIHHRRSLLDALPGALPLPAWTFETAVEARSAAERLAAHLGQALDRHPPVWSTLAGLLAEVERGAHDGAFAARLLTLLGPRRTAELPLRIEQAARAGGLGGEARVVDEIQGAVADALLVASRHTGPGRLSSAWATAFAGLDGDREGGGVATEGSPDPAIQARLEALGFGADLARALTLGLGLGTVATVLGGADKVLAVVRWGSGGDDVDGWDVAGTTVGLAGSVGMLLVSTGVVATPLGVAAVLGGSIVASAVAWLMGQLDPPPEERSTPESRRRRHSPTYDVDTGSARFPGGGLDRLHQDGAGGVLPPNMTR